MDATRLIELKHRQFRLFRRAVEEQDEIRASAAWARVCRLHAQLVAVTPPERLVA